MWLSEGQHCFSIPTQNMHVLVETRIVEENMVTLVIILEDILESSE